MMDSGHGGHEKLGLRLRAYVTASINQELLMRNEHLAAENRLLKSRIKGRRKAFPLATAGAAEEQRRKRD
jgi:hypothetical protein